MQESTSNQLSVMHTQDTGD